MESHPAKLHLRQTREAVDETRTMQDGDKHLCQTRGAARDGGATRAVPHRLPCLTAFAIANPFAQPSPRRRTSSCASTLRRGFTRPPPSTATTAPHNPP